MSDSVLDRWNDAASTYARIQEDSLFADSNKRVVMNRFQGLGKERVLDLGCGYGSYTDYFRSIGADAVGIDGAQAMVDIAKERYPECSFVRADIKERLPFEDGSFDIVFCNQVLMDIEDIERVFKECARILIPGGIFYYSIVHPAFFNGRWKLDEGSGDTGKLITSYITPSVIENRFWGETLHFHRPLSFYLNAASKAGLMLIGSEEPKSYDDPSRNEDIPLFFFAEYINGGA